MSRSINDLLFGAGSSDEDDAGDYAGDSSNSDEEDESDNEGGFAQLQAFVNHSANTQASVNFRPIAQDDDDDVQILTAAEAAAEVAAAARRAVEYPNASRKRKRPMVETKPEPTECTICCEDCTIVGRHRLVALKCGHLFGRKCIERWISEKRTCPNCNAIVQHTDICMLFSDHVAVVDNSGLEDMTNKFEEETKKRSKLEKDVTLLKQLLVTKTKEATQLNADLAKFKKTLAALRWKEEQQRRANIATAPAAAVSIASVGASPTASAAVSIASVGASPTASAAVQVTQSQFISRLTNLSAETQLRYSQPVAVSTSQPLQDLGNDGFTAAIRKYKPIFDVPLFGARVFSIARSCRFLCVGEKLAQGSHGLFLVNSEDSTRGVRVPVHSSDVRDMCIHSSDRFVLTVAFDGKLAMTSLPDKKVTLQIELPQVGGKVGRAASVQEIPMQCIAGFKMAPWPSMM